MKVTALFEGPVPVSLKEDTRYWDNDEIHGQAFSMTATNRSLSLSINLDGDTRDCNADDVDWEQVDPIDVSSLLIEWWVEGDRFAHGREFAFTAVQVPFAGEWQGCVAARLDEDGHILLLLESGNEIHFSDLEFQRDPNGFVPLLLWQVGLAVIDSGKANGFSSAKPIGFSHSKPNGLTPAATASS